jgi:endonuclease/exonuclease/phosphatase (EEP) superfamily protein YafD
MNNEGSSQTPRWLNIFGVIVGGYGLIVLIAWILQWALPTTVQLSGLIESVLQLLMFPVLVLFPLCLLLRRWRVVLLLLPVLILFFFAYGRFLLPRVDVDGDGSSLRVLTFNIQAPEQEIDPILDVIRDVNADVVAIQELNSAVAGALENQLSETYPHQALHPRDQDNAGQGVLSRFPIVDDEYWRNDFLEEKLGHQRIPPYAPDRGFNADNHTQELIELLDRAANVSNPVILTGDFNMTDAFDMYHRITETYSDAYAAVGTIGFGFTLPRVSRSPLPPLFRIDYVFYDRAFVGVEAHVWSESGGSDHLPVLVRLVLNGED